MNGSKWTHGSIISYCASGSAHCNEFGVELYGNNLKYWNKKIGDWVSYQMKRMVTHRTHICLVVDQTELEIHSNNTTIHNIHKPPVPAQVPGGGVLIFGQNQDNDIAGVMPGIPVHSHQGFRGVMEGFRIWNRALNASEIQRLFECDGSSCVDDAIVVVDQSNTCLQGHVIAECGTPC